MAEFRRVLALATIAVCSLCPVVGYAGSAARGAASVPNVANVDPNSPSTAAAGTDTKLGSEAALSRDMALYESGQYQDCVVALTKLLSAPDGARLQRLEQVDQAKIYLGACLIASGSLEQADQVFKEAIRNNPQMRAPDNLVFPQTVVDRFLRVREQLLTDIRREERNRVQAAEQRAKEQDVRRKKEARVFEQLKTLARQEAVVEKNRRWLASVPFGVGQFQNGDATGGWVFLALESALVGTCATAVIIDSHLANKYREPGVDLAELRSKRIDAYRAIIASSWGFIAVASAGIVHANLRFVPERRTLRTRPLPPELEGSAEGVASEPKQQGRRSPSAAPSVGIQIGPTLGIIGTF